MVLHAYASINKNNINAVKQAIALFGVVDLGIELPISAQAQVGGVWDVTNGPNAQPGSWGGHSIVVAAYDASGLTGITWGALQKMTWAFWDAYVDEAFLLFFNPWKNHEALQVEAFDEALQAVTA
jgi:hypothetical protein